MDIETPEARQVRFLLQDQIKQRNRKGRRIT